MSTSTSISETDDLTLSKPLLGPFLRRHAGMVDKKESLLTRINRVCRIKQKIVMFMIGVSFHIFSVFRYNYLMDCVGTTKSNYSYASSVVCLASFFVSNIWVFIAQRSRLLFGTFIASSIAGSACLLAIRMLQRPVDVVQPFILFLVKFSLFCIFFGCLKSFFSIAATATIKNLSDKKYYAEQFCFFLLGSIAVNTLFSYRKFEPVMLNFFWIAWTALMLVIFKITVGVRYFDAGEEPANRPHVVYSTFQARETVDENNNRCLVISNDLEPRREEHRAQEADEGYRHLFSNANYRFFLLITTLVGYTCSTFIIFAPSLQAEDLNLSISERTKIESFGNVSELLVYTSFRFLFPAIPPYWLAMICCLSFLTRAVGYIAAVVLYRTVGEKWGFWMILGSDGLKGLIFGMLQPAYITFITWYCSPANKSIALGIYNGIFYGVTGFICGIGSGALRGFFHAKFATLLPEESMFRWLLGTNCCAFFVAIACLLVAIGLLIVRFWVLRIGTMPDYKAQ